MTDSFQDLLQQISDEHDRVVKRLQAENEELKARLERQNLTGASGIQGRETRQLSEAAYAPGNEELSQTGGTETGTNEPPQAPSCEGALMSTSRQALDEKTAEIGDSSSQLPEQKLRVASREEAEPPSMGKPSIETLVSRGAALYRAMSTEKTPTQDVEFSALKEKLRWLTHHDNFELFFGGLILLNTASMALELQYNGLQTGYQAGYRGMSQPADEVWPGVGEAFPIIERTFTCLFCIELSLRICGAGCPYFFVALNWVDITVVGIGVLDWASQTLSSSTSLDIPIIRLLRLLRLLKGVRILTKFLGVLKLLITSIQATCSTLFYSLCLLLFIQIVAAMFMVQLLNEFIADPNKEAFARHEVYKYWGSFTLAFITMFEITLANWSPPCRVLVTHVDQAYFLFFLVYRCMVGFAVLGVINAVFIQKTLQQASNDQEIMIMKQRAEAEAQRSKLGALFKHLDTSGDGSLGWEEFQTALQDPHTVAWMKSLEIDVHDLETLFAILDGGDGSIDVDEFIKSMARIKGPAKSLDMMQVLNLGKDVHKVLGILSRDHEEPRSTQQLGSREVQRLSEDVRRILDLLGSVPAESRWRLRSTEVASLENAAETDLGALTSVKRQPDIAKASV